MNYLGTFLALGLAVQLWFGIAGVAAADPSLELAMPEVEQEPQALTLECPSGGFCMVQFLGRERMVAKPRFANPDAWIDFVDEEGPDPQYYVLTPAPNAVSSEAFIETTHGAYLIQLNVVDAKAVRVLTIEDGRVLSSGEDE